MKKPEVINPILGDLWGVYRVGKEPSWLRPKKNVDTSSNAESWEVPCKRGGNFGMQGGVLRRAHIGYWGKNLLCFSGVGMRMMRSLLKIKGVTKKQEGDEEFTVVFHPKLLPAVAAIVRPMACRKAPPSLALNGGFPAQGDESDAQTKTPYTGTPSTPLLRP